ncbi:MAG: hypothetical protein A4E53_02687 [Pelotomaculum sp. PtaB.Bin104]|nr:MAG: hypothetical protein A4E53_02687 [Pelotomaculum sp. PtaB.Bin104]
MDTPGVTLQLTVVIEYGTNSLIWGLKLEADTSTNKVLQAVRLFIFKSKNSKAIYHLREKLLTI